MQIYSIMYYGKRIPHNPGNLEEARSNVVRFRNGAVFNAFLELEGIINKSALARQYFGKSQAWLSQRINGSTMCDRQMAFTAEEARQLADAFRDLATRLNGLAAEIYSAADTD
ncbi:MAG: DUF5053 domain-containing protein [Muribaculaceae bacterium]|nr:DUF5053 domain-containing protein [Muribaculaceae bacterium]